ncbi:hypothetical protein Y032_0751g2047 [Ancylostoma ceylanicum]|nr:hypothetical protein Y032_0751g2047 [Ancylostoma ceylanicum]
MVRCGWMTCRRERTAEDEGEGRLDGVEGNMNFHGCCVVSRICHVFSLKETERKNRSCKRLWSGTPWSARLSVLTHAAVNLIYAVQITAVNCWAENRLANR